MEAGVTRGHRERRETGRARLDTKAVVHLASSEMRCSTRDLSVKGIALTGATTAPQGSFLRLVLRLPGASRPIGLDGILVRSQVEAGSTTWGLQFHQPPRHVIEAVAEYVAQNRCDGPFARQAPRAHEVLLRARPRAPTEAEPPAESVPEPEAPSESKLDEKLHDLYESALDEPPEGHHGLWHRLTHPSDS